MFCLQCPRAGAHSARTNFKISTRRRRRTELWTYFAIKLYKSPRSGEKLVNTRSKHQIHVAGKKATQKDWLILKSNQNFYKSPHGALRPCTVFLYLDVKTLDGQTLRYIEAAHCLKRHYGKKIVQCSISSVKI